MSTENTTTTEQQAPAAVRSSEWLDGAALSLRVARLRAKADELTNPTARNDITAVLDALAAHQKYRALLVSVCGTDDIAVLSGRQKPINPVIQTAMRKKPSNNH